MPVAAPLQASDELEENPFARPSSLGRVAALVAAGLALFAAVFAARVLMSAITAAPAPSVPATVAPEPAPPPQPQPQQPAAVLAEPPQESVPTPPPTAARERRRARTRGAGERRPPVVRSHTERAAAKVPLMAAREPAPRREAAQATLRINSLPWSQVYLDGRLLGNTPLRGVAVSPGTHSLRLVNPQFSMVKTRKLKVAAGEVVTLVELLQE